MMAALPHLTPLDIFGLQSNDPTRVLRIQGWPVVVDYNMDEMTIVKAYDNDEQIKLMLCHRIAEELYKQKMIEFTKEQRPDTGDTHYRARIFAVPNTEVQLLRLQEIIK